MMKIREQNSGFKRFLAVIVMSSLLCSLLYAAAPTDISKYSTSGIVKQNGDDHNTMNIPCTYLAYKTGSCSSSTYVCLIVVSPSGVRKSLSAASNMGQYYFGNSSCWIYNKSVTSGSYRFFDLQAVEKGVWRLVFMQTNAGSWYYTQSGMTSKISFDANGGIIPSDGNMGTDTHATLSSDRRSGTVSVTYGSSNFSKMNDDVPVRDGYVFTGWWTSATGGTQVYDHVGLCVFGGYWKSDCTWLKTTDVTLYAQWREASYISDGLLTAGYFSVGEHKYVQFSQGNLQYSTMSTHDCADGTSQKGTWRFAANQYDYIGDANSNISSTYTGWIDFFGWGTSGWNSGAKAYQPYSTSTTNSDYYPGNLTGTYAKADWGVYNAISNGGNQAGLWRTLTKDEWVYLFEGREGCNAKYGWATIAGTYKGLIILPDTWTLPDICVFVSGMSANNIYTLAEWKAMEVAGAVFLLAAGRRSGTSMDFVGSDGGYWSSTCNSSDYAYRVNFLSGELNPSGYTYRYYGRSVRLVQDATKVTITTAMSGHGTITGGGQYYIGDEATLTATPATGSHFLKWSDGNTENPRTITVTEDVTYTAIFVSDTPESTLEIYQDCDLNIPVGALSGKFTVSETKQVYFAQGNLQYNAVLGTHVCADGSTQPGTWRFAEHQYDYVGDANANIAADYDGWIDMFGWGTSGWNNMNPYMSNKNDPEYCTGENDIEGTFYDWGVYNPIENGGNQAGMWRTLTKDEWEYLIQGRQNATSLFTMASVNGSNGYIILPDNWSDIPGITLNIGIGVIGRDATSYSAMNNISIAQWNQLEKSGAIFLPASGDRSGTDLLYPEVDGGYWSTISVSAGTAFCLDFSSNAIALYSNHRYYGRSVRLVQDVK